MSLKINGKCLYNHFGWYLIDHTTPSGHFKSRNRVILSKTAKDSKFAQKVSIGAHNGYYDWMDLNSLLQECLSNKYNNHSNFGIKSKFWVVLILFFLIKGNNPNAL